MIRYNKMQQMVIAVIMVIGMFMFTACGNNEQVNVGKGALQNKKVADVLVEQVSKEETEAKEKKEEDIDPGQEESKDEEPVDTPLNTEEEPELSEEEVVAEMAEQKLNQDVEISVTEPLTEVDVPEAGIESDVDYDLSVMNKDMVYATVYQMMVDPGQYEGKMIRMKGMYYATYFPEEEQYYYAVIIKDALACCTQGMEFIWGDGTHVYPDEYPEQETEVIVTGRFETYRAGADDWLYCHLVDSTFEVVEE